MFLATAPFGGAAATVLALFYDTDDLSFTTASDFLPGEWAATHCLQPKGNRSR